MQKPSYFEEIREKASKRWDQLEGDPDLAGPWHQLFKQVQSPRHIVSELLQNADDAGATEASIKIENGIFIFQHNGEDFAPEHLASICRFGYSNKRALHTIGFRGIGFKSTFSLGDKVELFTPSLSLAFHKRRFTEPVWTDGKIGQTEVTEVRVKISDEHRQREVEKNLQDWLKSPVSLLFFKNIRRIEIQDQSVHWQSLGVGPAKNTEWMALSSDYENPFLLIRSEPEDFPDDALREIKQERMLAEEDMDFPPCRVDIVLGATGRLFVVLPTGVETKLPFACNAPFIQDPARMKIKDPEISPTNRWLLERVGKLACLTMLDWLRNEGVGIAERAQAYGLMPNVNREDSSLEGTCATITEEAFAESISDQKFILTGGEKTSLVEQGIIIPDEVFDVWPAEQAATIFDDNGRPIISSCISEKNRTKLVDWGFSEEISKNRIINTLKANHLPKPKNWRQLLNLWSYISSEMTAYYFPLGKRENVRIVPVRGKEVLYSASEVVRLGEKRLLQSEEDWQFLSDHLIVLNHNWPQFLTDQKKEAEEKEDTDLEEKVDDAFAVLESIGLDESSDANQTIERVALEFFQKEGLKLADLVQLSQIAAKLGASAGNSFKFATRDRTMHATSETVFYDQDGTLETFFPDSWHESRMLHEDYTRVFKSCSQEEWNRWVASGRAGLYTFAPMAETRKTIFGKYKIEQDLRARGLQGEITLPRVTNQFAVFDWDFDETLWDHWEALAEDNEYIWGDLVEQILMQPTSFWSKAKSARAVQYATTGNPTTITHSPLAPSWILKLRDLNCLKDTKGFYRKPSDLMMRMPETESLMDVEPFVHALLDREATKPLLSLLGVQDKPTGPDGLLGRLRALSKAPNAPAQEVEKWYRRLDQMLDTCSTNDKVKIMHAFRMEKLILTEGGGWATTASVFLSSHEEDVPGADIIRASVRDLTLWHKIGVADRPTADLALKWLGELSSGQALSQDDLRRVRNLLPLYPYSIWNDCQHWLNLVGEWAPTDTFKYALTMQSLVRYENLHPWVKQATANFQSLPVEVLQGEPFTEIQTLASQIEERMDKQHSTGLTEKKIWLNSLGEELSRIILKSETEMERIRALGRNLAATGWQRTPGLEVIPYIDGKPAGTPRGTDVVWLDGVLYYEDMPRAKLARHVPEKLGQIFANGDVTAALQYCFDRSAEAITEYMEENFNLEVRAPAEEQQIPAQTSQKEEKSSQNDEPSANPMTPEEKTDDPASSLPTEDVDLEEIDEPPQEDLEDFDQDIRPRPATKSVRPGIMERYAKSRGYKKDGEDRFFHDNGDWVGKTHGERFPWAQWASDGSLKRYFWPREHCLEQESLEIDADVWSLMEKSPDKYVLLLVNIQDQPIEVCGSRLKAMQDDGTLTLYPAKYRLVFKVPHS